MNNGRINNTQRRVLAKLAVEVLGKKIQQARDKSGELVSQITEQVKEELGILAIDMEIEEMEKRIQVLKRKKEELGVSQYHNGLLVGSKAKALVEKRTAVASKEVNALEEQKTDVVSRIWTAPTMTEALEVLEEARK